jgi:hypothetical protein
MSRANVQVQNKIEATRKMAAATVLQSRGPKFLLAPPQSALLLQFMVGGDVKQQTQSTQQAQAGVKVIAESGGGLGTVGLLKHGTVHRTDVAAATGGSARVALDTTSQERAVDPSLNRFVLLAKTMAALDQQNPQRTANDFYVIIALCLREFEALTNPVVTVNSTAQEVAQRLQYDSALLTVLANSALANAEGNERLKQDIKDLRVTDNELPTFIQQEGRQADLDRNKITGLIEGIKKLNPLESLVKNHGVTFKPNAKRLKQLEAIGAALASNENISSGVNYAFQQNLEAYKLAKQTQEGYYQFLANPLLLLSLISGLCSPVQATASQQATAEGVVGQGTHDAAAPSTDFSSPEARHAKALAKAAAIAAEDMLPPPVPPRRSRQSALGSGHGDAPSFEGRSDSHSSSGSGSSYQGRSSDSSAQGGVSRARTDSESSSDDTLPELPPRSRPAGFIAQLSVANVEAPEGGKKTSSEQPSP